MKFVVHLFPTVCVKVINIEATSIAEAIQKAQSSIDLPEVIKTSNHSGPNVESVEWDEEPIKVMLVDLMTDDGKVIYDKSQWLDGATGEPLIDGKTAIERKALSADSCEKFMSELLEAHETLTGIAEQHGPRTLADLMYLHQAILTNGFIDHYPGESSAFEIAKNLPSGDRWMKFIKVEYLLEAHA